ncbi:MAG: hypothetical protein LUE14_09835 [Clostridiales bacterium]|nr:hypothetical protein [Clostridiales bacterium]
MPTGLIFIENAHKTCLFFFKNWYNCLKACDPKTAAYCISQVLINAVKPQSERLVLLRELAVKQMKTLSSLDTTQISSLPGGEKK